MLREKTSESRESVDETKLHGGAPSCPESQKGLLRMEWQMKMGVSKEEISQVDAKDRA